MVLSPAKHMRQRGAVRFRPLSQVYLASTATNRRIAAQTNAMCHYRKVKRTGSPAGKRTPERRAPKRQTIAWPRVTEFGPRTASSALDAALRLAAQEHHEIRAFAGLGAQRLVRDDQGRSRRKPCDTIQCVRWNDNPVERGLCTAGVRRCRLDVATTARARPALWLDHAAMRTSAVQ